ncbi:sulfate ABC transporter permease subunit CysW [Peribacillus simplex]|uniref:Sulfate transport system permease protein CysW n=1 Tax=Peribacillus simplex TaxID=1478 RepID=A0AAW7IMU9_9BACI|nr:sulfate ABC transporter permease subunit CysW [Peribacillus simplex]MDM5454749.1 sulfate ABC transporter permease subunit CysW [Peribacillus simplex]
MITRNITKEPKSIQWVLISIVLLFLTLFLVVPLIAIFVKAFEKGAEAYFAAIAHPDTLAAIKLTLIVVLITLPLNAIFGIVAAWTITKYDFKGKNFLITLIDLPFSVSPVIAGLIFVLLFGLHGTLGPLLQTFDIKVIFSIPGIVIASIFITFPFIARELIPLMQSQGTSEEEASLTLGAGGFKTFWYVTLPNIKWGLLYGVILCNARTIGEFGAVSVVSGHIRGMTNTMPLHIEILYNEYQFSAAFAVASLMSIFAIITLIIKSFIEWKTDFKSTKALGGRK